MGDEVAPAAPIEAPALPQPVPPRIGAGAGAFVCSIVTGQLALPQQLAMVWMAGGGFLAVYLYERRSGQKLSVASGAHLGWICGVFGFVVVTIALAATAVMLSDPSIASAMRDQLHSRGVPDSVAEQMMNLFHTPSGISTALVVSFVLFTVLPAFGGALGAKLLDRD